jgi:tetratricopeptide (TPR) repeat protein
VAATAVGALSTSAVAQSSARDRLKAEKCYSADGVSEMSCDDAKAQQAVVKKYPNATRIEPPFPKSKIKKEWDVLVKASMAGDSNALIAAAEAVLNNQAASINEKAESANQIAQAYLQLDKTTYVKPIQYGKQAIELNGLTNNAHYQLMSVLGQMLLAEKQYAEALAFTERFAKETGVDDLAVNKTRGNALYRLNRYPEAVIALKKAYDQDKGSDPNLATMLMDAYTKTNQKAEANKIADEVSRASPAADPNDKSGQVKQLLVLANAKQYEKAAKVFDDLYAKGLISNLNEYEAGYVSYSHLDGREEQAIKVINDGMAKGVIKPDESVYSVLGQSYYYSNNTKGAIEAWTKGAALSSKGELNLLLAQVLGEESRYAESKAAAQQALSKGTENRGNAYMLIAQAESEFGLNNKAAMIAALKEAEKDPETKPQAAKMLKQAGVK